MATAIRVAVWSVAALMIWFWPTAFFAVMGPPHPVEPPLPYWTLFWHIAPWTGSLVATGFGVFGLTNLYDAAPRIEADARRRLEARIRAAEEAERRATELLREAGIAR